jgi:hypothetical protein
MKNLLMVLGITLLSALPAAAAEKTVENPASSVALPELFPEPQEVSSCFPIQQSPIYSSTAASCAQAQSNVTAILNNYAYCECGFCSKHMVFQACESTQYGYLVKGYVRFSCKAIICDAAEIAVPSESAFFQNLVK